MATAAQIRANQSNAQRSTGPASPAGKQASSKNRTSHALCQHNSQSFYLLEDENPDKFGELRARLAAEYQPQTETERILVQRLADHEWLRMRALRLQQSCIFENQHVLATEQLALYLRYQTTHERAFYKALKELQTIRAQRTKEQIGFESQKRQQAAEQRAAEAHNLKKQAFELKKQEFELKKERLASQKQPEKRKRDPSPSASSQNGTAPAPATSPGDWEMAA
jgi:hypothetical protein